MSNEQIKAEAQELVDRFKPLVTIWDCYNDCPESEELITKDAKLCAIIAIEQVEKFMEMDDKHNGDCHYANSHWPGYYNKLKEQIQLL